MAVMSLESVRLGLEWLERRTAADWPNQPLINCGIERTKDRRTDAGIVTGVTVILDLMSATSVTAAAIIAVDATR